MFKLNTGKVVATIPIGEGNDSVVFEPEAKRICAANTDGTLNIIHEDTPEEHLMTQTVKTSLRSKTMA